MSAWIIIALAAHFLYALVFVSDKFILSRSIKSTVSYAFYAGFFGGFIIFVVPFFHSFQILKNSALIYSLLAGGFFTLALIFFYKTLQIGEASRAVPFVGALVPISTLVFSYLLGADRIGGHYVIAFIFLVAGSFIILVGYKNHSFWSPKNIIFAISAAAFFGLSFSLTKAVYNHANFISGFVWTRIGGLLFSLLLLAKKNWRDEIRGTTLSANISTAGWFFSSKILGATAVILQNYAISAGSVIIVNSLQSTQYIFLLLLAIFISIKFPQMFKETLDRSEIIQKIIAVVIIGAGLYILSVPIKTPAPLSFGVTFSQKFSEELTGQWQKNYLALLNDLKVKDLRLIAYWDLVEPEEGKFNFKDIDWQIAEAKKSGARVTLVVGRKTPRWPECHIPPWADKFEDSILNYIKTAVGHYKNEPAITAWQVENEPMFPFGNCKTLGFKFLDKEVAAVKSIDNRPVILTDAGELGFAWPILASRGDIFGTTLYRYVHNRVLGDIKYSLIPAEYFKFKAWWATKLFKKEILISELQAEPWSSGSLANMPLEEQYKLMNPQRLEEIIKYAENSGFPKAYLWGAEWWYWLKETKHDPAMWEEARKLF